jgi:hypothetical protein
MAASWGVPAPDALLDWLKVTQRYHLTDADPQLASLTLLDLPDHDSTHDDHRIEVDRLVALVDGMIWVLDPQKYADAIVHQRYLRPLAHYSDVMVVALNHGDELEPAQLDETLADVRRLLEQDGWVKPRVLATSALTGDGLDALRAELARMVKGKRLAAARLGMDVSRAAAGLAGELSRNRNRKVASEDVRHLETAPAAAAGVPEITQAALATTRLRGAAATGWPLVSWINRLRPDPLKVLHMGRLDASSADSSGGNDGSAPREGGRTDQGARKARVDTALRTLANDVSVGLPVGWARAVRQASLSHTDTLAAELDEAVVSTDLGVRRPAAWWRAVRVLQWVLIAGAGVGLLWLLLRPLLGFFEIPEPPIVRLRALPLPTVLVFGCLILGIVVGLLARLGVEWSAKRRALSAQSALERQIDVVAARCAVDPVNQELARYSAFVAAVARAL